MWKSGIVRVFIESQHISAVEDIKEEDLLSFVSTMTNNNICVVSSIRLFFGYLLDNGVLPYNPSEVLRHYRWVKKGKLPSVYTATEVLKIESSIKRGDSTGKRDYAMMLLAMPSEGDPGEDDVDGFRTGTDAVALGYHEGDYNPINPNAPASDGRDKLWDRYREVREEPSAAGLYNGNISWMNIDFPGLGRIWQLDIHCPETLSINLLYDKFWLPDGAKLFYIQIREIKL